MKQNIAASRIAYYKSEDFKNNYKEQLFESFGYNEGNIINRIQELFNTSNYETQKDLTNWLYLDRSNAKKVYDFITENLDDFITNYSGYYVGYTSLDSVEYGEQEEQLTGIYNHSTGKEYNVDYLRKVFKENDFCINDSNPNYAYYIISGGLHVDLLTAKNSLNDFLAALSKEVAPI